VDIGETKMSFGAGLFGAQAPWMTRPAANGHFEVEFSDNV
jgi:hypothetical protein